MYPKTSDDINNSLGPKPNYMVGLGYEHGAFHTLEDTGNFKLEKGIFVPTHRVPILKTKEYHSGVNPPPFVAY